MNTLDDVRQAIAQFTAERDWDQFHTPKNLVMALGVEAAELMELFQWREGDTSDQLTPEERKQVADEIADVQLYLVRLADRLGIDILASVAAKMTVNAEKYPAAQVRGRSAKYTEYT